MAYRVSPRDLETFAKDGFVLVRGLLRPHEANALSETARRDREMESVATARSDGSGAQTVLAVRDTLGDDLYSRIVRSERIVGAMQEFLGDEVYHYHHKLMLKEARVGGAWEWHQDYGYWYNYGCLYPTMASCFMAIDRATKANGCLQVVPGSHHLGRINHTKVGGQTAADPERMPAILQRLPIVYVEMEPGDGLFFHANVLHRSDANTSPDPRWSMIACYNTKQNDPYAVLRHNGYHQLNVIDDEAIVVGSPAVVPSPNAP